MSKAYLSKFTTSVYRRPTFSRIYIHFDSFLPYTYKIGMIHTLLYRCFWCHLELVKLMDVFKSNGYPENFINNCFKTFLDNKHRVQEKVITVPKKPLFLSFLAWTIIIANYNHSQIFQGSSCFHVK